MLISSSEYKAKVKELDRSEIGMLLVDFNGDKEYPLASSISASTTKVGYSTADIIDGVFRESDIMYTGSYIPAALTSAAIGWKGTRTSNSNGTLNVAETIAIGYVPFDIGNFWLVGTDTNYPVDFTMRVHHSGGYTTITVVGNSKVIWSVAGTTYTDVDEILFTITKISATDGENATIVEGGAVTKVCFGMYDLISMSGTEEVNSPGHSIGIISANDVSITLIDPEGMFVMSNLQSPFYNLMKPKIRLQPFVGIAVDSTPVDTYEMIPLGVFRSNDWASQNNAIQFTVEGTDRMNEYNKVSSPKFLPAQNMTLEEYVISVDDYCNLNATIDPIRVSSPYLCYSLTKKLRDLLQEIAEALPGTIYIDRLNAVRIRPFDFATDSTPVDTWSDDDSIIEVINPQQFSTCYSSIKIRQRNIKTTSNQRVVFLETVVLNSEFLTLVNIPFMQSVLYIEAIKIFGSEQVEFVSIDANPVEYTMLLQNNGLQEETVKIEITACVFNENPIDTVYLEPIYSTLYEKELLIDNPLMQVRAECADYANHLFDILANPTSEYEVNVRWDPSIELLDQVTLNDPSEKVDNIQCVILRQDWVFEGNLTAIVSGKRAI